MIVYEPSEANDALLHAWHRQLVEEDAVSQTLGGELSAEELVTTMQRAGTVVYIETREGEPIFVAWVLDAPLGFCFLSCWVAPRWRGTKRALAAFGLVLKCVFTTYPMAVSVTIQDDVALLLVKLGFTYLGTLPNVFGARSGHVVYYPRDKFRALEAEHARVIH